MQKEAKIRPLHIRGTAPVVKDTKDPCARTIKRKRRTSAVHREVLVGPSSDTDFPRGQSPPRTICHNRRTSSGSPQQAVRVLACRHAQTYARLNNFLAQCVLSAWVWDSMKRLFRWRMAHHIQGLYSLLAYSQTPSIGILPPQSPVQAGPCGVGREPSV